MATDEKVQLLSFEAAEDLSAKQYLFGYIDSSGQINDVASQGVAAQGVIYNNPAAQGRSCQLAVGGKIKVMYGDTITAGDEITTGADGRAEVAASGDFVCGYACISGVDADIGTIIFTGVSFIKA